MPIISNFPSGGAVPKNIVTIPGGGNMELAESLGVGPYTIEFDDELGEGGTTALPYVKKAGDTMTGALTIDTSPTPSEAAKLDIISSTERMSYGPRGMATFSKEFDIMGVQFDSKDVLKLGKQGGEVSVQGSKISKVASGTEPTDAVNVSQLTEVEGTAQAARDGVEEILHGEADLPYVKKDGDTMTGALQTTLLTVNGDTSNSTVSKEGIVISAKPQGDISQVYGQFSANKDGVVINAGSNSNSVSMSGSKISNVGDGEANSDAVTVAQLTARVNALESLLRPLISAAQDDATSAKEAVENAGLEGGPFLPLSGGTMQGAVSFSNAGSVDIQTYGPQLVSHKNGIPTITTRGYGFNIGGNFKYSRLQGISDPINSGDAANKYYVDSKLKVEQNIANTVSIDLAASNISQAYEIKLIRYIIGNSSLFIVTIPAVSTTIVGSVITQGVFNVGFSSSTILDGIIMNNAYPVVCSAFVGNNYFHGNVSRVVSNGLQFSLWPSVAGTCTGSVTAIIPVF